ncbi:hypothetical protein D3C79_1118040 [compost metagenome]
MLSVVKPAATTLRQVVWVQLSEAACCRFSERVSGASATENAKPTKVTAAAAYMVAPMP